MNESDLIKCDNLDGPVNINNMQNNSSSIIEPDPRGSYKLLKVIEEIEYRNYIIKKYSAVQNNEYCEIIFSRTSTKSNLYFTIENNIRKLVQLDNFEQMYLVDNKINSYRNNEKIYDLIEGIEYNIKHDNESYKITVVNLTEYCISNGSYGCVRMMFIKGCTRKSVHNFIDYITNLHDTTLDVMCFHVDIGWRQSGIINKRNPDTLILKEGVLEDIIEDVKDFMNSKEDYEKYGIPYKKVYMLSGEPGTGKTSLAKLLATITQRSLYILNFDQDLTDDKLMKAVNTVQGKHAIMLLEDIDCIFKDRSTNKNMTAVSFSALLNILDGANINEELITIITTNHIELLDAALIRPLRVDKIIKFEKADSSQIKRLIIMYNLNLKEKTISDIIRYASTQEMTPAGISAFLFKHRKQKLMDDNILTTFKQYVEDNSIKVDDKRLYV
jgi:hypothetical protein